MKKINLAITGCLGKMGQQLIKSSKNNKDFKIVTLTESRIIPKKVSGIKLELNNIIAFKKANVIIDFTVPKCTLQVLKIASKLKKRVVIGTTGFSKKEERLIKKFSRKIPILKAGNMSLGVNLLILILGCLLDATTLILVIIPLFLPSCRELEIDLVHFGVVAVVNCMIGLITPPYGVLLFVINAVSRIPLGEIIREVIPFLFVLILALFTMVVFPELVLWLPRQFGYEG